MEPFIGQVILFAGNYAPRGWAFCNGQVLPISEYTSLFSIISNYYGGDGRTNFAVPDLRGRTPIGSGTAPGLSPRYIGTTGGMERIYLNTTEIPSHSHTITNEVKADTSSLTIGGTAKIRCNPEAGNSESPEGNYNAAKAGGGDTIYSDNGPGYMNENAIDMGLEVAGDVGVDVNSTCGDTGGNQPHENMPPWLCMNYIIALEGEYPVRS